MDRVRHETITNYAYKIAAMSGCGGITHGLMRVGFQALVKVRMSLGTFALLD